MYNNTKAPAIWKKANEHFSVSEGGSLKPDGDGYDGRSSFLNLETCAHILNNLDSFKKAVEIQRSVMLQKETGKERAKLIANLVRTGLTPEQAVQAVESIFANAAKLKAV